MLEVKKWFKKEEYGLKPCQLIIAILSKLILYIVLYLYSKLFKLFIINNLFLFKAQLKNLT